MKNLTPEVKGKIMDVVSNYKREQETIQHTQSRMFIANIKRFVANTLIKVDETGKKILSSTEAMTIPHESKPLTYTEYAIKIGEEDIDPFKWYEIIKCNNELVKNNAMVMCNRVSSSCKVIDDMIDRISIYYKRYIRNKSIKTKELEFNNDYKRYNSYIHGVTQADKNTYDLLKYTLLTKDFSKCHHYAKVFGKWLLKPYYYLEDYDLIITSDYEIIDIGYLASKSDLFFWLFDITNERVEEYSDLCIVVKGDVLNG